MEDYKDYNTNMGFCQVSYEFYLSNYKGLEGSIV